MKRAPRSSACPSPLDEKIGAVSRLVSNIAHKVNNPLTYSMNYLFVLKQTAKTGDEKELLQKVEKGIIKSKDFIQEIVDLSRTSVQTDVSVDLKKELPGIVEKASANVKAAIKLTNCKGKDTVVSASWMGLYVVLSGMIQNSVEAGAAEITVSCKNDRKHAVLTVSDNGHGMGDVEAALAFEPMHATKQGHKGLGLYSFYHIIKSFGGKIELTSRAGKGVSFNITLNISTAR